MSETEHLAFVASVPVDLAALVVLGAMRAGIGLDDFRGDTTKARRYVVERRMIATKARALGYKWWEIGRALNRDHASVINLVRPKKQHWRRK